MINLLEQSVVYLLLPFFSPDGLELARFSLLPIQAAQQLQAELALTVVDRAAIVNSESLLHFSLVKQLTSSVL